MSRLDLVLAFIALALFAGFCLILVGFVPEIDLTIVLVGVVAMAVYDFWRTMRGSVNPRSGDR